MCLDNVLGVEFLGEVHRQRAVLVMGPLEVCPQEPVDGAHEFDFGFGTEEAFEATLDLWVFQEVHKVFNVESKVERFVGGRGLVAGELSDTRWVTVIGGGQDTFVETRVVDAGFETQTLENGVDNLVLVSWTAPHVSGY